MGDALEIGVAAILGAAQHGIKALLDDESDPEVIRRKLDEFHAQMRLEVDTLAERQAARWDEINEAVPE